jgi:DNA-binding transcriptional LysR family regulator
LTLTEAGERFLNEVRGGLQYPAPD